MQSGRLFLHLTTAIALSLAPACASRGTPDSGARPPANVIGPEEIAQAGPSNAYELIQRLRPLWLRTRGSTSFRDQAEIRVYVNGVHVGSTGELRNFRSEEIALLQFLDPPQANYRFGPGNVHGAILLTTKKAPT